MNKEDLNTLREYFLSSPRGVPERLFTKFAENADTFIVFRNEGKFALAVPLAEGSALSYVVLYRTREDEVRWFSSLDTVEKYILETCNANPFLITFIR